jgi:hypothetical protein
VARALRALSSCYVERRAKLARHGALDTAGKRAAFALFYGPLHFLVTREIIRAIGPVLVERLLDLGCGTGAAGAAWALEHRCSIRGVDRHPWAVAEASWTYRVLGIPGRAEQLPIERANVRGRRGDGILAAYAVNELADASRRQLLPRLLAAHAKGSSVLIVEPIARGVASWWDEWAEAVRSAGGRTDEWRFPAQLPDRQRQLAHAAGLRPRELTARSLWLG